MPAPPAFAVARWLWEPSRGSCWSWKNRSWCSKKCSARAVVYGDRRRRTRRRRGAIGVAERVGDGVVLVRVSNYLFGRINHVDGVRGGRGRPRSLDRQIGELHGPEIGQSLDGVVRCQRGRFFDPFGTVARSTVGHWFAPGRALGGVVDRYRPAPRLALGDCDRDVVPWRDRAQFGSNRGQHLVPGEVNGPRRRPALIGAGLDQVRASRAVYADPAAGVPRGPRLDRWYGPASLGAGELGARAGVDIARPVLRPYDSLPEPVVGAGGPQQGRAVRPRCRHRFSGTPGAHSPARAGADDAEGPEANAGKREIEAMCTLPVAGAIDVRSVLTGAVLQRHAAKTTTLAAVAVVGRDLAARRQGPADLVAPIDLIFRRYLPGGFDKGPG